MTGLHSIPLFLQPSQIRKLQSGATIRLAPHQYGGPHELLVPKAVYNRITGAQRKGAGVSFHLSDKHIRDNIRSGKGVFSSLLNKAKDLAKQHLPGLIDKGVDLLREKAGAKLPQSIVDAAAKYGRDFIRDKTGYGLDDSFNQLAAHSKRRRERGAGLSRSGGGLSRVGGSVLQDELTTNLHLRH